MRDLTAQVTSGLLQFPEVTIQALGEDEITLESVLHGKFAAGKNGLAYLACGPQLEVVNSLTGERLSAYRFSGVNEQPPIVLAVKEFSWQKRTGLLIGLEEAEGSVLCLYDLGLSRVVKAIVLPGRVTAIEPIINHGGASASTQHLHPSLRWLFGVAAVVTDVGQILLIDLCLDDLSCNQNEVEASDLEVVTGIPAEVPHIRENVMREGRHLCFQLVSPSGTAVSALSYINRTNQLAVGFSDGYLALWNMKSMKREYYTQLEGGRVPVYAVTFQEPENDPRNCCYLWAAQSTQDSLIFSWLSSFISSAGTVEGDVLSLHLLQLAFGDRKCLASGQILYEGLEYCEERYTLDLTGGMFPLRGQTGNTKLLGCQSIEKFRSHGDREESMNEALSPDTSVSVFTWQVNIYGQGKPSVYLGLFDINRWYHAQMPDSLRSGEYLHNCSYFALWSLDAVVSRTSPHYILDILVHERSLSRGVPPSYPPPEQFFNPSTYNFDATCLLNSGVVHVTCTGFQKETLTFLKKSGPSLNEVIPDGYNRCLVAGLLSPRLIDIQPSSLSQEEQLEAILSAAIQTSSLGLLTGCIKRWITEEQPNSAANLRFVLEWTWNKVILTKEEFDRLCTPLFDGSCRFIDPQTIQSLQQCHLLLSNLSTVLSCFATEAHDITERGLTDLSNKYMVTQLICQYAQVVLWFSHSGLLPEGLDDAVQLSRLCYNYPVIQNYYTSRRQKCERSSRGKWNPDCLMIDGMISQLGDRVEKLWKRDEGGTGKYPPTSLHALLDIYLLDNITEASKHSVTIYLLLDIMYSFPNKTDTSIESFPTAFAISWGQVKLIQGFWLIDHNDYESGLDLLFHPATAKPVSWQHSKIIEAFMSQGEHRQALRYIQTMKPTMSSGRDVILHLTVLLFNRCMVEAWTLLRQHSNRLNIEELLKHTYEACQEMGLMEDLLKLPFTDTEQECLVRFLQSSASVQNHEFLLVHHLQRANYIPALKLNQTLKINLMNDRDPRLRERSVTRNSIIDQYGKILPRVQRKLAIERAKPYHLSASSVFREVSRPKPLSAVPKQAVTGTVLTRSTFINNVLSKIGEIWASNEPENNISVYNSPKVEEPSPVAYSLPDPELPEAFVGTPVTKASQRISRLLDLVVQPVPQPSECLEFIQQSPTRSPWSLASGSLPVSSQLKGSRQNASRASELHLLETPLVVKKAKTLAMSVTSSGFAEFTPQSILRSGLRTTPLASPSLSPGRSLTPPLRLKETRISFMEEGITTKWTAGTIDDSKTKTFITASLHKCGAPAETEWLKNKDKTTSFPLDSPEKDHQEMDVRPQDTTSQSLEKLDVSVENSNTSTRSDQTTLEYQDAPLPEDFEDILIASKSVSSSTELITNLTEQTEKNSDKDTFEPGVTPPEPEKHMGTLEDAETKNGLVVEGVLSELNHLSPIQGVEASLCVPSVHEEELTVKSTEHVLDEELVSLETCTSAIRAAMAEVPGDGGRSGPVTSESPMVSEHRLDQEVELNLKEDHEIEVDVLKASVDLPEDKPPISDDPPDTQEIHVIEHEKLEGQDSGQEARNLSFNELYASGTLKLQYNFDTIEQQFCDLPDNKDSAECDVAEVDGEHFVTQSNFTLILEGEEGEVETDDCAASDVLAKAANAAAEEKHVCSEDSENHRHVANLPSVITSDQESQRVETLPYVPEPIKVTIAENLLDVIKDTRSKEITSDTVEQSIQENIPLISQKVMCSTKLANSTTNTVQETSAVTINVSEVNDMISSRTRKRVRVQNLNVKSAQQEEPAAVATPEMLGLSVTKKTRKTKEIAGALESACSDDKEVSHNQQIPQNSVTPRRGRRKKDVNQDILENANSVEQELQVTPGRELRRLKSSQLLEAATEESYFRKEVKLLSATKRTPRRTKSVENQEGVEVINDLKVSKVAGPSRSTRKLRSTNLEASEGVGYKQEGESTEQQLPIQRSKRVKKKEVSALDVIEDSKLDSSQLTIQADFGTPATPRKRGRPRKIKTSEDVQSKAFTEARSLKEREGLGIQRRSTRNTPAKSENTDVGKPTLEESVSMPNEELAAVMSSKKKLTKRTENQSQKRSLRSIPEKNIDEETAHKEPDDQEEKLLATVALTKSSRSTRTRSSKAILLPDLSEPKNESLLFSPPVSKIPRKEKAKKIEAPAQLQELVSDLPSQFVSSPPALRTRQKNPLNTSRRTDGLENDGQSTETEGKQQVKRIRTAKTKQASKNTERESWSPPPVEIKLISPLASPVDGVKSKPRKTAEVTGKTVGRSRKKLSSFPKQVLRRKML
ncbi:protein ELYS isoform X4 [Odocoileus virginianus]|uniref:Protein ELYS isoform X4 n=1 Tax=Odocoileus virginianus TaxID=9874 RepID=A0A6J0ZA50_ODOVR|nr:protein ELYS isoform X3 [Odocoileus virginianus texanus]XP_020770935.1 protein ELYS isoform X3 [Odocoileus virginianus texanus]XP_020770936.1 protein ELYS isoform X3 [Odocoileus virginianus texanus]XP_020770937.1 protein ELYS isoform X3 [Odocoileus virginianus texanus]XP_020770938.1 protein ELYS isoform X3 [Odocoileus virginianus texanus]XP_020770939.1 protein ELYS isoform X3 [Odocoileus virginianus texanus]